MFDRDGNKVDYDPDVIKQYFLADKQQLSFRWDFTIPYSARAGGEVYLRAIHMTPERAEGLGLNTANVLAVTLGDPVPVYTLGAAPDFGLGFEPPFLPSICSDTPLDMQELIT